MLLDNQGISIPHPLPERRKRIRAFSKPLSFTPEDVLCEAMTLELQNCKQGLRLPLLSSAVGDDDLRSLIHLISHSVTSFPE